MISKVFLNSKVLQATKLSGYVAVFVMIVTSALLLFEVLACDHDGDVPKKMVLS